MITKELLKNQIIYDYSHGIEIRPDDDNPKLPLVEFKLIPTPLLVYMADRIRGKKVTYDSTDHGRVMVDEIPTERYVFYYGLNLETKYHVDQFIMCEVVDPEDDDFEVLNSIDLSAEEQKLIRDILDRQLLICKEKTCDDLLSEAWEQIWEERKR